MPRFPESPMVPARAAFALAGALSLILLAATGCQLQRSVSAKVTTADGQELEVPLNFPEIPASDGVATVSRLEFRPWVPGPDKAKQILILFEVDFKGGAKPKDIEVDDVTEAPILALFEDKAPRFVKEGVWAGVTAPFDPHDEHVKWVLDLDNDIRVYRFTIKLADGSTHMVYKPVKLGAVIKNVMRHQLGVRLLIPSREAAGSPDA